MTIIDSFPNDLKTAKELVYDTSGFKLTNPQLNAESKEYGACSFELNGKIIQHRVSKVTPTKTGQFVTIWKRNEDGITAPFDLSDEIDFIIITTRSGENLGQFIFPKKVLAAKGIITQNDRTGKRGIRVYPPWDIPENRQAEQTQNWQLSYFLMIKTDGSTNLDLAKKIFTQDL